MPSVTEIITILHVDDDPEFVEFTANALEREDERFTVETTTSTADALDHVESGDFDCVVSDYDMPEMDGLELLETVREDDEDLPFILFTGKGSEKIASEAFSAGASEYLPKGTGVDQYTVLANRIANTVQKVRTQAALVEERSRNAALFECFTEPVVAVEMVDTTPIIREVNAAFESTFGYDVAEATGQSVNELLVPSDEQTQARHIDERIRQSDPIDQEIRRKTVDGQREFLLRSIPVEGESLYFAVYDDITELKDRERELEAYAETITELHRAANRLHAADSIEECYRTAIDAAVNILGFDWCTLAAPADDSDFFEIVAISENTPLETGDRPFKTDEGLAGYVYQTKDASIVDDATADDRGEPTADEIRSALTVPVGDWGIFQAVTTTPGSFDEQDRENAELLVTSMLTAVDRLERQAQLERQNDRLEQFASIVSHDLRNPLNVAQGRLQMARDEHESQQFDFIEQAHDRMETLIDDLLTLARQGETAVKTEAVALSDVASRCWQNVQTADATLVVDTERTVRADPSRLKQLLENCFRNAIEHGGDDVTVTVGDIDDGFYVEDDGDGIPEDARDCLFEVGYSGAEDGTGFGLGIVAQVADIHGWDVHVTDGENGGARFEVKGVTLMLPAA